MNKDKLDFLTTTRFWALVIGSLSLYLKNKGWIGDPEMIFIASITAGFSAIRTLDRFSEKINSPTVSTTTVSVPDEIGDKVTTVVTTPITPPQP